jgi:hypothetical protein
MKRLVLIATMTGLLIGDARDVAAYDCTGGGLSVAVDSVLKFAQDATARLVYLQGSTTRSVADGQNCPGAVRVEGWIEGDPAGAEVHQGTYVGRLGSPGDVGPTMQVYCAAATYRGQTRHWFIKDGFFSDPWTAVGSRSPTVNVPACPPEPPPSEQELCEMQGSEYYWNGFECVFTPGSPIIIDTARNGYKLTNVANGVLFDLNADGVPEHIAWTEVDSDDAFLAIDMNGNGRIDDGTELFGNYTRAYADRADVRTKNGFEALKFIEGPSYGRSNGDGTIDSRDGVFARVLLWRDVNHNGLSEPDELQAAGAAGVAAFSTEYKEKKKVDQHGNEFRQKGQLTWADGVIGVVYDVWLKWQP